MDNLQLMADLTPNQMALVESEYQDRKKSKGVMFALWWFLGGFGGHRFYLGDKLYGFFMLITLGGIGLWWIIDGFIIIRRHRKVNEKIKNDVIKKVLGMVDVSKATVSTKGIEEVMDYFED